MGSATFWGRRKRARKARRGTEETSFVATCAIVLRCVMHHGQAHNGPRTNLRTLLTAIVSHVVKFIILDFPLLPVYPWAVRSLTTRDAIPSWPAGSMRRFFLLPHAYVVGGTVPVSSGAPGSPCPSPRWRAMHDGDKGGWPIVQSQAAGGIDPPAVATGPGTTRTDDPSGA